MYEHILEGGAYGPPYELVEAVGDWAATFGSTNPGVPNGSSSYGPVLIVHTEPLDPWTIYGPQVVSTPFWLTFETFISVQGYPMNANQMPQNAQVSSTDLVDPTTGQPLTGQALNAPAQALAVQGMNAAIQNAYTAMGWNPNTAPAYTPSGP